MIKYVEFRKGLSNTKRDNIIPLNELPVHIDPNEDCYRSLFFHDDELVKHVKEKGTVSGFRGKAGADRLIFDLDHKDLEVSRKDTITLVNKLISDFGLRPEEIGVFFSGRKGFAVEIKTDGIEGIGGEFNDNIPFIVKRFCKSIGGELDSFDGVIYNLNRLYRINGTLHQKQTEVKGHNVQLFKTSIPLKMLKDDSIESILEYSMEMRPTQEYEIVQNATKLSAHAKKIIAEVNSAAKGVSYNKLPTDGKGLPDASLCPKGQKVCMWRLSQGAYTQSRDNALLRVAVHEKKMGMPHEVIKGKLSGVLELMNLQDPDKAKMDPITDYDLERIVKQAENNDYDFGCNDDILSEVCGPHCHLARNKHKDRSTVSITDSYKRSKPWFREYFGNIVTTGIKSVDDEMPLFLSTFNLIVGKPGTGKTSLMLNILKNASAAGNRALFFSQDMGEEMLIQRFAPILLTDEQGRPQMSGKDFMIRHARGDKKLMDDAEEAFSKLEDFININYSTNVWIDDIRREIKDHEKFYGEKPKLVIVDYVQLLGSDKEGYARHTENAIQITNLAKETGVCILGLSQTPRGGKDEEALAKGSGAWEEKASTQLNCWRPFRSNHIEHDWVMSLRMVKNRIGPSATVDLFWHGPSGILRDLKEEEEMELTALKEHLDHDA